MSKLNTYKIFLFCLIAWTVGSCKSYYTALTIETPRPAKEELPSDIQSITLMNRSLNNQFLMHREDSLQLYFYRNGYQLSAIVLDSMAADTTIRALAGLMFESGRYDVVVPIRRNFQRSLPYDSIPDTLNPVLVSQLCRQYNTDALMVMEQFATKVMTDYTEDRYVDRYSGTNYSLYASLDLKYDALFRIYKPGSKTREIKLSDTINWESDDITQLRLFSKLPTVKQALINAGIKIALDVDDKISPSWIPEKRGYYVFNQKSDLGRRFINENNTDEAKTFWMDKAQSTNKKIRSRAEFNLALASELEGNVDQAIEWGLKSFYTQYDYRTEVYLKKLRALKESQLTP
ncbi:MAG TPA: hypothetical protein DCL77_03060 [Prolixibacteraceae bacterium]|jgi:hypothetical protein|nr:hypothetical protein [Prolixibacteraceae bacterium]